MSADKITKTLQEFGEAIASDDYDTADEILGELSDLYGNIRAEEMEVVNQLHAAMGEEPLSSDELENAHEYFGQKTSTNLARTGILAGGKMYLIDPYNTDEKDIVNGVEQLIDHEVKLQEQEGLARKILTEADVPATISILRVSDPAQQPIVGDPITLDVVIKNVGEETASNVEVTCEAPLEVEPTSETLGDLAPGAERTIRFEFVGDEGDHDVQFTVDSDNAGSDFKDTALSIVETRSSIELATGTIAEIRELITTNESLSDGWTTALLASLDSATASIDKALEYLEEETDHPGRGPSDEHPGRGPPDDQPGRGRPDEHPGRGPPDDHPGRGQSGEHTSDEPLDEKQIKNALTTAINQLGAFLNKVADFREESTAADDGPIVADGFWISLQSRAEIAIDQLAWARRADDVEDLSSSEDEASSDDDSPGRGPPEDRGQ